MSSPAGAQSRPAPPDAARAALDGIGAQARRSNLARVTQLEAALSALSKGELSPRDCERSEQVAHQLVGSAGTFGFHQVSELGRQLEMFFSRAARGNPGQLDAAAEALERMQQDLTTGAAVADLS